MCYCYTCLYLFDLCDFNNDTTPLMVNNNNESVSLILGDGCCIAPSTSNLALVSMHCSSCCAPRSRTASHSLSSPRRRRQMEGRIGWVSSHSCQQIACKRIRCTFQACRAPHQPRYVRVRVVRLYICEGGALGGTSAIWPSRSS